MLLNVLRCQLTYKGQAVTNAEAWFNIALRPCKPEGSLGRTAQDGHLDSHTAPELWHTAPELCPFVSLPGRRYQSRCYKRLLVWGVSRGSFVCLFVFCFCF